MEGFSEIPVMFSCNQFLQHFRKYAIWYFPLLNFFLLIFIFFPHQSEFFYCIDGFDDYLSDGIFFYYFTLIQPIFFILLLFPPIIFFVSNIFIWTLSNRLIDCHHFLSWIFDFFFLRYFFAFDSKTWQA